MNDKELIARLIELAEWADANEWEVPIDLGDTIMEAVERLKRMQWIPVGERLPEPGKEVLAHWRVLSGENVIDFAYQMDGSMGEDWRFKNWVAPPDVVTHWMPMPEPPEENEV